MKPPSVDQTAFGTARVPVRRVGSDGRPDGEDAVAVEEPLEIRLGFDQNGERTVKSISITMRTPGQDFELACGFLFSESIIRSVDHIQSIQHCGPSVTPGLPPNVVRVDIESGVEVDYGRLERHFYTTSSCGVCGKASIEALSVEPAFELPEGPTIPAEVIHQLPAELRAQQAVFETTGGLHAAALFDLEGNLVQIREDVGRHNALDKLIGWAFRSGLVPLHNHAVMLSGRVSFELIQKAMMAGVPLVAAVGAPSSLAIDLARTHRMTVLGFVRDGRFNVYSGEWRVAEP